MFLKFNWKMLEVKLSLQTTLRRMEGYTYSATHFFRALHGGNYWASRWGRVSVGDRDRCNHWTGRWV